MSLVRINNVSHYFGGLKAVNQFNLHVEQGELIGLIGPNGAGKTTIFNLVTGAYTASEGEIIFDGQNIVGESPHTINNLGISRTFQTIRLWGKMSVLDNVRVAQHAQIRYNLLDLFFQTPRYHHNEDEISDHSMELLRLFNLDQYADKPASILPYGEQRRLEIIRAMAAKPKLILLDEPAAGMNPQEIDSLMTFIRRIRDEFGMTIWLIEHQMQLVMNICERISVLDFGSTIAEGTPEEIQNNPKVIEAYLGESVE